MADSSGKAARYEALVLRYFQNAEGMLARREPEKAGECLWGAVVVAAKASAARRGLRGLKYGGVKQFVLDASKELRAPDLFTIFLATECFHGKFYEGQTTMEEVSAGLERVRDYFRLLLPGMAQ